MFSILLQPLFPSPCTPSHHNAVNFEPFYVIVESVKRGKVFIYAHYHLNEINPQVSSSIQFNHSRRVEALDFLYGLWAFHFKDDNIKLKSKYGHKLAEAAWIGVLKSHFVQ